MFIDFRKRGKEKESKTSMWERNIDQLLPIHTRTRDRNHNLLVNGWHSNQLHHPARAINYYLMSYYIPNIVLDIKDTELRLWHGSYSLVNKHLLNGQMKIIVLLYFYIIIMPLDYYNDYKNWHVLRICWAKFMLNFLNIVQL